MNKQKVTEAMGARVVRSGVAYEDYEVLTDTLDTKVLTRTTPESFTDVVLAKHHATLVALLDEFRVAVANTPRIQTKFGKHPDDMTDYYNTDEVTELLDRLKPLAALLEED